MQKSKPRKLYLSDLTHGPTADAVCVRVMRKWSYDGNEPGGPIRYIGLVLADEKGNSIYGHIIERDVQTKGSLLEVDSTYHITKFYVKTSKQTYVPFDKELMIEFTSFTNISVMKNPPNGFPQYVYTITPYSQINPVYPSSTKYIDILGIITSVENVVHQRIRNKEKVVPMREILIKNLSDEELKITLWAEHATSFKLPETSTSEPVHSIVVLFVGCLPKTMERKTQVSGGNGCRWYFNPDIKEAQAFYKSLQKKPVPVYQAPPPDPSLQEPVLPIILEHKKLSELNDLDPFEFPEQGCKCTVTITSIPPEKKWWYIGCAKCKKAPKEETSTFWCGPCKCSESKTLYKFSFNAADDTTEAQFFAYDDPARNIIHRNVIAVLNQLRKESGFPRFLTDVVSKKFTFSIGLSDDSFGQMEDRTYVVKSVIIDHQQQAHKAKQQLLTEPSANTSAIVPTMMDNMQTIKSSTQYEPATPIPDIITNEASLQQDTPPPNTTPDATPKPTETRSISMDKEKTLVQRALFADHVNISKEQAQSSMNAATSTNEMLSTDIHQDFPGVIKQSRNSTSAPNTDKDMVTDENLQSDDLPYNFLNQQSHLTLEHKAKKHKTDESINQGRSSNQKSTTAKPTE
ncbi:replication protein A 70 kDa DNA-binding subunit B-like isoform X1 [Sorghum bicolor]|uniref:replication protein A 70 kDa DNA-binding subunit B-like isoform X1 n=1 Tax=Sorghum bicolor TaxID=4558 RepID=UPI00081ACF03|nr:replication protein A 70 kDa DNA-binding subunit B-like isoform X1 [Sorghum bicolor]|eukprot:XP_021317471.1 replication protein A 70 kDa DNA-binding subunit B-like isoform X1 [Sorghum bicolor]